MLIPQAHGVVIYDFSGECAAASDCSGVATGVLTLADTYSPGTTLASADFIYFEYTSSQGSFVVLSDLGFLEMCGALPTTRSRL